MNFLFSMTVHGFEKAGKLEKSLKEIGIPYEVKMLPPVNPDKKKQTKMHITKIEVAAIINISAAHSDWDKVTIAKNIGCSRATVERVLTNTHVLQLNGNAPKVREGRLQ